VLLKDQIWYANTSLCQMPPYRAVGGIVGTLWPIRSVDGRAFSKEFYNHVHSQSRRVRGNEDTHEATNLVDLAQPLQQAILTIWERQGLGDLFNWAAFVLYGAWIVQPF
jgi:CHAT domain-containing protein